MSIQIALMRGVNVGGHGKLPMAEWRSVLEGMGASDVETYIQSGNAVYNGALTGEAISDAVEAAKGFRRPCLVISAGALARTIAGNPFPEVDDPKTLHAVFLSAPADPAPIEAAAGGSDRFHLSPEALYLHTPEGFSKSDLAKALDRAIRVPHTARNWKTVLTLAAMADR